MEIVVLVKQVPDTESLIQIADDGVSIKTDTIKWVMNPYDELAVGEALKLREDRGGTVTILSMGPQKTQETIRTALAMGADKGIHIKDGAPERYDALATAKILSAAIKEIPYDIIIAGQRAVDQDNYQVPSAVAEYLGIPQVSMVVKAKVADGKIQCHRTIEGGTIIVDAQLPALFTTQRGLNEPRYASLPGIMKAKKKPLNVKTLVDLGLETIECKVKVKAFDLPLERQPVRMIEGDSAEIISTELVRLLHEETGLI